MKIAYLSNSPLKSGAANAVHVMHMCSCFSNLGHVVGLFAKGSKKDDYFSRYGITSSFKLILIEAGNVRFVSAFLYGFLQSFRAKIFFKPDLCYARCFISAFFALALGMPIIIEVHELPHNRILDLIFRYVFKNKNTKRVVVISKGLCDDLMCQYTDMREMEVVIAHDGASITRQNFEQFFLQRGEGCQIGYAGGMRSGNGIGLIIDLANMFQHHTFHLLGGSEENIKYWAKLQKGRNIVWYGHQQSYVVSGFLKSCDILLAPYQEGPKTGAGRDTSRWMSPLKLFEYMASGQPMIASDFPVLREILSEKTALLVTPGKLNEWASALEYLITHKSSRERIGSSALQVLQAEFTWEKRAQKVLKGLCEFC